MACVYLFSSLTGGHELSKTTGNAGARVGCGNLSISFISLQMFTFHIHLSIDGILLPRANWKGENSVPKKMLSLVQPLHRYSRCLTFLASVFLPGIIGLQSSV